MRLKYGERRSPISGSDVSPQRVDFRRIYFHVPVGSTS